MFRTHALQFYKVELYLRNLKGKLLFVENLFSIISFWENIHMVICVWLSYLINYYHPQRNLWDNIHDYFKKSQKKKSSFENQCNWGVGLYIG